MVTTVCIKHAIKIVAAMAKTITTAIRMIEIVVAAVVVSAMWESVVLWMTTSVVYTITTMNMLIPEAIDWKIIEH